MSDDLTQTVRVPGPSEIVGFFAAGLPFLLSTASSSSSTVNGEVVAFVYRDWTAVGGGVVAMVCGVISLLLLRRRTTNKPARIAIAVGLLVVGGFHLARGFGVMASGAASSSSTTFTTTTTTAPTEHELPAVDVDKPTQLFAERWTAGKVDEIYRDAHPKLRSAFKLADMQRLHVLFDKGFGTLTKLGTRTHKYEDAQFVVTAPAVFEQGELALRLSFAVVGDTAKLIGFKFDIPKPLQRDGKTDDADQIAATFVDALLAGTLDRSVLDPRVVANLGDDVEAKLEATRKDMGKSKLKLPLKQNVMSCDSEDNRCLQYNLRGTKNAKVTVELEYSIRSWLIVSFNFATE